MEKQFLTITELSELIKVKKSTIYDFVYRKKIPYTKVGNQLRFDTGLINAWLESRTYIPFGIKKCYNHSEVEGEERLK